MRKVQMGLSAMGGVCEDCLTARARGVKWAERAHQCRTDTVFAKMTYDSITASTGKKLFITMFGLPAGCSPPTPSAPTPTGTCR